MSVSFGGTAGLLTRTKDCHLQTYRPTYLLIYLHIFLIRSCCTTDDYQLLNLKLSTSYYKCSLLDRILRQLILILIKPL
jgi:hypothetical protein